MGKQIQILCDNCSRDLTSTGASPQFRLHLMAEALPHTSVAIHAVMVYPPIKEDKYFCGLSCLEAWLANKSLQGTTNLTANSTAQDQQS
jgi:hypothetical protein